MPATKLGKTLNDRQLAGLIHPYRFLDNSTNLIYLASLCVWLLPEKFFVHSKLRPAYTGKITSVFRMGWLTGLETALAFAGCTTGVHWAIYFWLLWAVPLFTTFPYLMLLRDLVQHANADDGKLTNSRVVFCNPFIRWAMFVYGQDFHLTHHLYPAVPHYRLPQLHSLLQQRNTEYAEHVVECHGFVRGTRPPAPSAMDVMQIPTREPPRTAVDQGS